MAVDNQAIRELRELNRRAGELVSLAKVEASAGPERSPEAKSRAVQSLYDRIAELRDTLLTVLREQGGDPTYVGCALEGLKRLYEASELVNESALRGVRRAMQHTNPLQDGLEGMIFGAKLALETRSLDEIGDPAADIGSLRAMQLSDLDRTVDSLLAHVRKRGAELGSSDLDELAPVMRRVVSMTRFALLRGEPASPDFLSWGSSILSQLHSLCHSLAPIAAGEERKVLVKLSEEIVSAGLSVQTLHRERVAAAIFRVR